MRALFLYTGTHWCGSARAFAVAARGIVARGGQAVAVCSAGTSVVQGFSDHGIDVVTLPVRRSLTGDSWRVRRLLKDRFVEAVFVHTEREHLVVSSAMRFAQRGAVIRRIPVGASPTTGRRGAWAARLVPARVMFSTDADRARAVGAAGALLTPIGVDVARVENAREESRRRLGIADSALLIACAIDNAPMSRVTVVLRVLAFLAERHPTLRLLLVGRAALVSDIRMHAASLGITSLISTIGEQIDMPSIAAAADVGWAVADGDDGAFACLDFMAAGVPIVAERTPIISTYVPDGIAGVLLPYADPAETASVVARLLRDNGKRQAMGNAGRTRARRDFSERAMIDGFIEAASSGTTPDRTAP